MLREAHEQSWRLSSTMGFPRHRRGESPSYATQPWRRRGKDGGDRAVRWIRQSAYVQTGVAL